MGQKWHGKTITTGVTTGKDTKDTTQDNTTTKDNTKATTTPVRTVTIPIPSTFCHKVVITPLRPLIL